MRSCWRLLRSVEHGLADFKMLNVLDGINHAFNFVLPAGFIAIVVPWAGRRFKKAKPMVPSLYGQIAINFAACVIVLVAGLLVTGRDGKMLTYVAMVVASGTVQWFISGAWRRA